MRKFIKNKFIKFFKYNYQLLAWNISICATIGSIYLSEILKLNPCVLCWYQRIVLYPITIILGVALLRKDKSVNIYILLLSTLGMFISIFHYFQQKFINKDTIFCFFGDSCNVVYFDLFGFITIPLLSFGAFFMITILLIIGSRFDRR